MIFLNKKLLFLQAFTLVDFPAPMSLCSLTSFFGTFMTATVQLVEDHEFKPGWPLLSVGDMIGYSLLVISTSLFFFFPSVDYIYEKCLICFDYHKISAL